MNDIEILEEFLEDYIHDGLAIQYRVMEAIENLIQRNKDLEQIEKEHKEENGRLRDRIKELEKELEEEKELNKIIKNTNIDKLFFRGE